MQDLTPQALGEPFRAGVAGGMGLVIAGIYVVARAGRE